jgi:hypothetical protein
MPEVSRESATQGGEFGPVVDRSDQLEGYTVRRPRDSSSGDVVATERTDGWTRQRRVTLVAILAAHRLPARRRGRTAGSPRPLAARMGSAGGWRYRHRWIFARWVISSPPCGPTTRGDRKARWKRTRAIPEPWTGSAQRARSATDVRQSTTPRVVRQASCPHTRNCRLPSSSSPRGRLGSAGPRRERTSDEERPRDPLAKVGSSRAPASTHNRRRTRVHWW